LIKFSDDLYKTLKVIALVWLPAFATLYSAMSGIWGLPDAKQVIGSISALDTFLGVVLHISSSGYTASSDGQLVVGKKDASLIYQLELQTPPEDLASKDKVILQVSHTGGSLPQDLHAV
jgi:hypothetical protein